jgi:excisionase family DNA binding protein
VDANPILGLDEHGAGQAEPMLLSPAECAHLLAISRAKVYDLVEQRLLPGALRIGGSIRIHRPTLLAWLAAEASRCLEDRIEQSPRRSQGRSSR